MTRVAWVPLAAAVLGLVWFTGAGHGGSAATASLHHAVVAQLDPASGRLRVRDRFAVGPRDTIDFALASWLEIESARLDGEFVRAVRVGGLWRLAAPGTDRVEVVLVLQGRMPELPDEESRSGATGAVSGEEGCYLPGYAAWIADTGDTWVAYDLTVEVPSPYRAVATGQLVAEQTGQGVYRAVFASERPAEPPSIFAGPYEISERDLDGLRLRTYFHGELADLAEGYLDAAAAYIARYQDEIGPYPFRDFHMVSAPLPVGLGFASLTYVGRRILPLPFMRGRSLAHEVLHNWWGNGVAVDYENGNWAEGLTTYLADYALAAEQGEAAAREMRLGWLRDYAALPEGRDIPAARFTAKTHDAAQVVGYGKVAFVFHMLRRELGDRAFLAALRSFWRQHRQGTAGWAQLRQAFEQAAGRDLGWFFEQWLERAGAPRVELVDARPIDAAEDYQVAVTLRQAEPVYRIRLTLIVETAGGPQSSEVFLDRAERTFTVLLDEPPRAVRVDPQFETFRRLLPGESPPILRDVTLSADTVVVVPSDDKGLRETAGRLAARLLQREPTVIPDLDGLPPEGPVLLIAGNLDHELPPAATASRQLSEIAGAGTARAWTFRDGRDRPWLVVTAEDSDALEAVLRPLPHYRSRSYVVFEGSKAIRKGVWVPSESPLSRRFDG